jgi:hypothetical protein
MFTAPGDEASNLADRIKAVVNNRAANAPRSQQKRLGLSEVGEVCVRKLGYKLLDWEKTNPSTDPWASISGTAIHAWLADAFDQLPDQYLVEHPVKVTDELGGTADLFDKTNKMVIDHKCVGATSMRSRKKDGMTHTQRVQINLYGLGFEREGYEVEKVALAFYPLGGRLDGLHTIIEPYNRQLALDAIERLNDAQVLLWQLDPENTPQNWQLIPSNPTGACNYCPWYMPFSKDLSVGCPGQEDAA